MRAAIWLVLMMSIMTFGFGVHASTDSEDNQFISDNDPTNWDQIQLDNDSGFDPTEGVKDDSHDDFYGATANPAQKSKKIKRNVDTSNDVDLDSIEGNMSESFEGN